ncbi:MAG: type II toxin-antitoxin system PemK/MazF family toxin [Actinomycetia bacterium]|nr:type II toxin-antitoxin system PemK/MazF family toxin [Actinomycetes bacterium]
MINRGQVWHVSFDEKTVGREQAGTRPALVLSSSDFNSNDLGLVVVIPITTAVRAFTSHVPIKQPEGGLRYDSSIMCEQVKSVSNERLKKLLGTVSRVTMSRVEVIISNILELPF